MKLDKDLVREILLAVEASERIRWDGLSSIWKVGRLWMSPIMSCCCTKPA